VFPPRSDVLERAAVADLVGDVDMSAVETARIGSDTLEDLTLDVSLVVTRSTKGKDLNLPLRAIEAADRVPAIILRVQ
jgi:hypothetical protein